MDRDNRRGTEFGDQFHQFELSTDVEVVGGLVQDQHRRLLSDRPGQHHTLLFSAGQFGEES